ncbi:Pol Polyprotein [Phytophthora megakarya]|uniref:Pol Polyprotein n=1 Tax=Phytophthora megakarya TaxID=4795 RepID=A0A225WLH8_9STRA|nr:Pol Polyprotein [Phytophthora megakarya]
MAEKFAAQQLQMQTQLQQVAEAQHAKVVPRSSGPRLFTTSSEHGSGTFTDYMKARDRSMRMGSLDESEGAGPPASRIPRAAPEPVPFRSPPSNPPPHEPVPTVPQQHAQFFPPQNFGLKLPKMKDLDCPGFPKFSGKEIYAGVSADFLAWGKKFVQRLVAAQMMNGGDWPDDFKILALNNKLEGPALAFFAKMLSKWTAESNTVEHVMDRMLGFYSTKVPVSKAMNLMFEAKSGDKPWTEHFQYLVYVAERAGCPDQFVLLCLCDSAPEHVKKAMLTHIDSNRVDHIQQAWELVAFAAEYEISSKRQNDSHKVSLGALMLAEPVSVGHAVKKAISRATGLRDESLLQDAVDYSDAWSTANGGTLKVTKRGTVALRSVVDGCEIQVDLTNVFYCKDVTNNIISYGLLEEKGKQHKGAQSKKDTGQNALVDKIVAADKFWGYAVEYAAYVLNRSSCSANAKRMSPTEVLTGKCPDLAVEEHKKAAKTKVKPHKKMSKDRPSVGSDDGDHGGGRGSEGAAESLNTAKASSVSTKRMRTRHMGKKHWMEAMQVEIEALENNNTWEVVVKPRDCKFLHTKWVYKTKTHADGTVERRKGRLVAYGNEQVYGVDYTDTFSAMLDMTTGKVIFVLAHIWNVPARHGDVLSVYVKADKEDHIEIFLHIPKGMEVSVELLALLGVKHNNERVESFFKEMVVLEVKDLGVVSKFLGIGFEYGKDKGWLLEQRQVIQDLLDKFGLASATAVRVYIGGENDNESEGDLLPKDVAGCPERRTVQTFQSLVGGLLLAKKIACYLKGTIDTKFAMPATDGSLSKDKV